MQPPTASELAKQSRISQDQDSLYNLHEIAYDIPGFIWKISIYPDLLCICGSQEIVDEVDRVLLLDPNYQLLSYDTTFLCLPTDISAYSLQREVMYSSANPNT